MFEAPAAATADVEGVQSVMLATLGDDAPPMLMPLSSCANSSSGLKYDELKGGTWLTILNAPEHGVAILQYWIHGSVEEGIVELGVLYCTQRLQRGGHIVKVFGILNLQRYNTQILAFERYHAAHHYVLAHAWLLLHAIDVLVQQLQGNWINC